MDPRAGDVTLGFALVLIAVAVLVWPGRSWMVPGDATARVSAHVGAERRRPAAGLRLRLRTRRYSASEDVTDALVLIALALRAGLPLIDALHQVQRSASGQVQVDLAAVVAALRWGRPVHEAWTFAGPVWRPAAVATHMAERTGAAPAALLERAAHRMREERERDRERRAARAGVLLVLPLGLGFLPAFACTAVVPVVLSLATGVLPAGL